MWSHPWGTPSGPPCFVRCFRAHWAGLTCRPTLCSVTSEEPLHQTVGTLHVEIRPPAHPHSSLMHSPGAPSHPVPVVCCVWRRWGEGRSRQRFQNKPGSKQTRVPPPYTANNIPPGGQTDAVSGAPTGSDASALEGLGPLQPGSPLSGSHFRRADGLHTVLAPPWDALLPGNHASTPRPGAAAATPWKGPLPTGMPGRPTGPKAGTTFSIKTAALASKEKASLQ